MGADITASLVSKLKIRLEDGGSRFEDEQLRDFLSEAQFELATLLHDDYLDELTDIDEDKDASGGYVAISSLNSGKSILKGAAGITNVKVAPGGSSALYATPTDISKLKELETSVRAYSDTNPYYYIWKSRVYVLCTTSEGTTADIFYLKPPPEVSDLVDPIFNKSFHNILLDLAEAKAWLVDERADRSGEARKFAYDQIKMLNDLKLNEDKE